MKPMLDAPEAAASMTIRSHKRKTIPRDDVLKSISTALTQQVIDVITAEAALEYITPAQVIRRIILKHYKHLLKG
jgi:predicted RNase H-like nuclease